MAAGRRGGCAAQAATWVSLNGTVNPTSGAVLGRSNLAITQFTSIATVPQVPDRFWGGTQDNGTLRKSTASNSWFDVASGDGGQVLVDHTDDGVCQFGAFTGSCFVYGTYFGISPYRVHDGGAFLFNNSYIRNGIDLTDGRTSTPRSCSTRRTRTSSSWARIASIAPTTRRRRTPVT